MPHDKTETVFYFDELSDGAKEKARDWWRTNGLDYEWWDSSYEWFEACAKALGIEIANRRGHHGLCIFFSGFSSQGDGACFEGSYSFKKGWRKALRSEAPKEKELVEIGAVLSALQKPAQWGLTARAKQSGRYYHAGCMNVEVFDRLGDYAEAKAGDSVVEALRDFANWMYRKLQDEYEWLSSDEQVDEAILANQYEFTEDGAIA